MVLIESALIGAVIVALTGVVATAVDRSWDLFAVFVFLLVLQPGIALSLLGGRRFLTLRIDLAHWLDERAALTGEAHARIANR